MKNSKMKSVISQMQNSQNQNTQDNKSQYSIDKVVEVLNNGSVYIPKEVIKQDVYEETKLLFGVVFTDCVIQMSKHPDNSIIVHLLQEQMIKYMKSLSDDQVRYECCCSKSKISLIRDEMKMLINTIDIGKCINERTAN